MQHGSKTLILRPCRSVPFSVDLACENGNYGSDSLAALSPSFGRDFHIHYIISGTMIIAVILSVFFFSSFKHTNSFYIHFMLFKSKRIFTVQMKTLKQIQKCHRKIKRKKIESEAEKKNYEWRKH